MKDGYSENRYGPDNKKRKLNMILIDVTPYSTQNSAICFLPGNRLPVQTAGSGLLGKLKNILKHYGKTYYFLIEIFQPSYTVAWKKRISSFLSSYKEDSVILNLGSGPAYFMGRKDIINIDAYAFDEVDIVADVSNIPIVNNSADFIIGIALLEHVSNPEAVIREMHRIIKEKGVVFCFLPFIQPFHAAPDDFQRWTLTGIKNLFSNFDNVEVAIAQGPASGFLWIFQEWLSVLFSFGSKTLHDIIYLILVTITAPLKLLDSFMMKFPHADRIASGFYVIAKKLN